MESESVSSQPTQRVILVSYDGKLTGSQELRDDNKRIFTILDTKMKTDPKFGDRYRTICTRI